MQISVVADAMHTDSSDNDKLGVDVIPTEE